MKFSLWLERKGVADAILGALGVGAEERSATLSRKTTYFGSEIRGKLKGLGVVKGEPDYGDLAKGIDDGITVGELIKRVSR